MAAELKNEVVEFLKLLLDGGSRSEAWVVGCADDCPLEDAYQRLSRSLAYDVRAELEWQWARDESSGR